MQKPASPITPDIDLSADGKHCGYLRIPHSVHRSAYGFNPMPVVSIRNGDGPVVLFTAGVHGDEYEGQVALTRLAKEIVPDEVAGQIILIPMANYPAAKAGLRTSPIDELNLNREFPGNPRGTITAQIADYIESVLMDMADYHFDVHSGGSSLHYLPTVLYLGGGSEEPIVKQREELVKVFGAPYAIALPAGGVGGGRGSGAAAFRQGVVGIGGEFGGSGMITPESLMVCERGLRRLLDHLGVWHAPVPPPRSNPEDTIYLNSNFAHPFLYAEADGLFEPAVELGDRVEAGQVAGQIHHPERPWLDAEEVTFQSASLVLAKRVPGAAERGDCLFHLGEIRTSGI